MRAYARIVSAVGRSDDNPGTGYGRPLPRSARGRHSPCATSGCPTAVPISRRLFIALTGAAGALVGTAAGARGTERDATAAVETVEALRPLAADLGVEFTL